MIKTLGYAILSHGIFYHSPWKLSHGSIAVVASCCRGACFCLGPPPSPPSSRHSAPPSPITCSGSSGWVGARLLQTRVQRHPVPLPLTNHHHHHHHASPLSLSACFPLSSPYCSVLCDLLKPGRHVITLLDTKNSRQPVFLEGGGREGEGKQSDTTSQLSGHYVRPENMPILPENIDYTWQELV